MHGRVRGELAGGVGAIGCGIDADPVTGIADINASGMCVLDRQGCHLGRGHGFTPRLLDGWHGWRGVGRGGHGLLRGAGFGLANGHDGLHNGAKMGEEEDIRRGSRQGLPAVQTGSAADRRSRTATVTNEWAENAPQPNRTIGPSAEARRTRKITGIGAGRRHQDTRDAPKFWPSGAGEDCTAVYRELGRSDADLLDDYPGLTQTDLDSDWGYYAANPDEIRVAIRRQASS